MASNGPRVLLDKSLAHGGLSRWLPLTISADDVATPKPHPACYLAACAALGVDPAGAVNQLTGEGQALDAALTLAGRVQAHSRDAVHVTKQIVQDTRGLDDHTAYTVQDPLSTPVFHTAEATEGAHAFTDKRPPAWHG